MIRIFTLVMKSQDTYLKITTLKIKIRQSLINYLY